MKILICGGCGHLGRSIVRRFRERGDEVMILSRKPSSDERVIAWDGRTLGPWTRHLDGADFVINLAGRSVNCRYTPQNLKEMFDSRVESARVVGLAIEKAARPPRVWLQMSTATIYAHRFDAPNDEFTGFIGGAEPNAPSYWKFSVDIAKAWEQALLDANTPFTRKVALRTAMVMTPERGGVFDVLLGLTRRGMGGAMAGGHQYVSWIHEKDFLRALLFLTSRPDLDGAVNLAAPNPIPQRELMSALRAAAGVRFGLPVTRWMAEFGAFLLRTDTELTLKSRRVVPKRLLDAGFEFMFPEWPMAARDLVARHQNQSQ